MKKLILMLLLCIPISIFAKEDINDLLTKGTYTITYNGMGQTFPLTGFHTIPNEQGGVIIELPSLADGNLYYDVILARVSDNASIGWFVEPNSTKCYFNLDLTRRTIFIQVYIKTKSNPEGIVARRDFTFKVY